MTSHKIMYAVECMKRPVFVAYGLKDSDFTASVSRSSPKEKRGSMQRRRKILSFSLHLNPLSSPATE